MEEALREFGIALGKLKRTLAEEYNLNVNYIDVNINSDNYITLIDGQSTGGYTNAYRQWVDIDIT